MSVANLSYEGHFGLVFFFWGGGLFDSHLSSKHLSLLKYMYVCPTAPKAGYPDALVYPETTTQNDIGQKMNQGVLACCYGNQQVRGC